MGIRRPPLGGIVALILFDHPYNETIRNERAIELPLAFDLIHDAGRVLEVGNVLGNYERRTWVCVDKYEHAEGVRNRDVLDITGQWDRIVSVSTIEHVGWDETPRDPAKAVRAMSHLRSLLAPGGQMLVTVPTGWNSYLDDWLPRLGGRQTFYAKSDRGWSEAPFEVLPYDHDTPSATGLWVGEWHA